MLTKTYPDNIIDARRGGDSPKKTIKASAGRKVRSSIAVPANGEIG